MYCMYLGPTILLLINYSRYCTTVRSFILMLDSKNEYTSVFSTFFLFYYLIILTILLSYTTTVLQSRFFVKQKLT